MIFLKYFKILKKIKNNYYLKNWAQNLKKKKQQREHW